MDIIPDNLANGISSTTGAFMSDFSGILELILGVLLASLVIAIIIGALKK